MYLSGSGIGGTALAYMIQEHCGDDIEVNLYEAAPQYGEIGAGLRLWPRTLRIFEAVGLGGSGEKGYERYATYPPEDARSEKDDFYSI